MKVRQVNVFGVLVFHAMNDPSCANPWILVGDATRVRAAGAAGATASTIPTRSASKSATPRPTVILKSLLKLERSRRRVTVDFG